MSMTIRSFIAINITETLRAEFSEIISVLKKSGSDMKWVRPENLHLTLKFLGNVEIQKLEAIKTGLKNALSGNTSFDISFEGIGCFPNFRKPRVIWIGIKAAPDLQNIYRDVENALFPLGIDKEKRSFSPHLTLGRFNSTKRLQVLTDIMTPFRDKKFGAMRVNKISLMKSELLKEGARYSVIAEFDSDP